MAAPPARECAQCHRPLSATAKFCGSCGTESLREVRCPECGTAPTSAAAAFCGVCGTDLRAQVPPPETRPKVAPAAGPASTVAVERPSPRRHRALPIALAGVLLVAVAGIGGWLLQRDGGDGNGGGAGPDGDGDLVSRLPDVYLGEGTADVSPELGGRVVAGIASVEVRPLALSQAAELTARLSKDGAFEMTLDPPLPLEVPALVTLPMPEGAEAGEDAGKWPVALLESPGEEPLVLQAEAVSGNTFSVLVPHFSTATPTTAAKAAAKTGAPVPGAGAPYAPAAIDARVSLPEDYDTDDDVSTVVLSLRPRARTSVNGGYAEVAGGKVTPDWSRFANLRVRVFLTRGGLTSGMGEAASAAVVNGDAVTVSVDTGAGKAVRVAYVRLEDASGRMLVVRSVTLPVGQAWKSLSCTSENSAWREFTVYFLWDPRQSGHPDNGYGGNNTARPLTAPSRALDACEALSDAYSLFDSPRWFHDSGNAPDLPMDVWLQPWQESSAGRYGNYLSLGTAAKDWDSFKRDSAHELAHRFQHQYSYGFSGAWFHDASAEYLANRIYNPDEEVIRYAGGGTPNWLNFGLANGTDVEAYAASSFLAYISSNYGINVARLWVEGAGGAGNARSWEAFIDSRLKAAGTSLGKAWQEFGAAYLVDQSKWGTWTGVSIEQIYAPDQLLSLSAAGAQRDSGLYEADVMPAPYLSGGGRMIRYAGATAVTIGFRLTDPNSGRFARSGDYSVSAGTRADGKMQKVTLSGSRPLSYLGSFRLGKTTGALGPDLLARVTFVMSDWEGTGGNWGTLELEAWALPPPAEVKYDEKTAKLTWEVSPLEDTKDKHENVLFDRYELVARVKGKPSEWKVVDTKPAGELEYALDANKLKMDGLEGEVCVRVRDAHGFTSPEACPSLDVFGIYSVTSLTIAGGDGGMISRLQQGGLMTQAPCVGNPAACQFEVYHVPAFGKSPEQWTAALCIDGASGRICAAVADSDPYEPDSGLLPPTENDNYFALAGPKLTGRSWFNVAGNPGYPAMVVRFREVNATFSETGAQGTITILERDVTGVNTMGPVNRLILDFEATKVP